MKDYSNITRRNFFRGAGLGAAALAGMPLLAQTGSTADEASKFHDFFAEGDVVLTPLLMRAGTKSRSFPTMPGPSEWDIPAISPPGYLKRCRERT
jgi:hypothetical protein